MSKWHKVMLRAESTGYSFSSSDGTTYGESEINIRVWQAIWGKEKKSELFLEEMSKKRSGWAHEV